MLSLLLWLCRVTWKQVWHNLQQYPFYSGFLGMSGVSSSMWILWCFSISVKKGMGVFFGISLTLSDFIWKAVAIILVLLTWVSISVSRNLPYPNPWPWLVLRGKLKCFPSLITPTLPNHMTTTWWKPGFVAAFFFLNKIFLYFLTVPLISINGLCQYSLIYPLREP